MVKKGLYIWALVIIMAFGQGIAQVPLFPDDDSVTVVADTLHNTKLTTRKGSRVQAAMPAPKSATRIDSLINHAYSYMGNRYRRGGTSTAGFDCSGFTMTVFKYVNIKLPHTSAGQGLIGVDVSRTNIQKGDLILFRGGNRRSRRIGHVGIVVSEKGEPVRFIHSSTSEGVRVDQLNAPYYQKRYVKTVRIPELYH